MSSRRGSRGIRERGGVCRDSGAFGWRLKGDRGGQRVVFLGGGRGYFFFEGQRVFLSCSAGLSKNLPAAPPLPLDSVDFCKTTDFNSHAFLNQFFSKMESPKVWATV